MSSAPLQESGVPVRLKTRVTVVLFVFALWFGVIVVRLAQCMLCDRERHLAEPTHASVYEGLIPARRGRLLDRDGVPLAWSSRCFVLTWRVPADPAAARSGLKRIAAALPRRDVSDAKVLGSPGAALVLCRDLSASEAATLRPLFAALKGLKLTSHFVRHRYPGRRLDRYLGQVVSADGTEVGVSGLELSHDAFLRGQPGVFRVMVDKRGRWIPQTWEELRDMRPGYDVVLPVRVATLVRQGA